MISYLDYFSKLGSDIDKLDPNELTIVTYDKDRHELTFNQVGRVIVVGYISQFFLPKKRFRRGVLTPTGRNELISSINKLQSEKINLEEGQMIPDIRPLGTDWYRLYRGTNLKSPQKSIEMKYVNITNPIITWITCRLFSPMSKILYKATK